MSKQDKHTHKLKRLKYKTGNAIFFCVLPDCKFKTNTALALGKRVICWRCGQEFIMSEYALKLAKPHCENCHKPKKEVHYEPLNIERENIIDITPPLSLAERLKQTIESAQQKDDGEI